VSTETTGAVVLKLELCLTGEKCFSWKEGKQVFSEIRSVLFGAQKGLVSLSPQP